MVVERFFAWAALFRRLARDYERLTSTFEGMHYPGFTCLAHLVVVQKVLPVGAGRVVAVQPAAQAAQTGQ